MKHLKISSLAMFAAAALTAFVGVGTAAAVEGPTSLCKVAVEVCAAGEQIGSTTILEGATKASPTEGSKLVTSLGTIICDSNVSGHVTGTEMTRTPSVPGTIGSLTFTNCTIGGPNSCTINSGKEAGNANNLAYTSRITTEGVVNQGTLNAESGGSGSPGVTAVCGAIINCTFSTASANLHVVGGAAGTAVVKAENVSLSRAGSKCPSTSTWTATYFLSSPANVFLEM